MVSILLPTDRIAAFALVPRLFSGNQEGALGGDDLAIPRIGDRWTAVVSTAQLRQNADGRALLSALTMATTLDARMPIAQPHVPRLAGGSAPVVAGTDQAGSAVAVRGMPAGTLLEQGRYFSILHLGIHHVYMVAETIRVASDGTVTVAIWPMLRFLSIDGERVYFDTPMIEGKLVGFDKGGRFVRNRIDPFEFSIVERK